METMNVFRDVNGQRWVRSVDVVGGGVEVTCGGTACRFTRAEWLQVAEGVARALRPARERPAGDQRFRFEE